jgi:hypothetical protein
MRPAGELVRPAAHDDPLVVHDQRADQGIGARTAAPALGQAERAGHVGGVVAYHFSSNSAVT